VLWIGKKLEMGSVRNSRKSGPKCKPAKIHISPKWGAIPPNKTVFVRVPRAKISKGQMGEGSPQGGVIEKVPRPQNFLSPFSRKLGGRFFFKFQGSKQTRISVDLQI